VLETPGPCANYLRVCDRLRIVGGHDQGEAHGLSREAVRQARRQLPNWRA
jgi:hypothetical protein